MAKQDMLTLRLRIVHDGVPPNVWDGPPDYFGVHDKQNVLYPGKTKADGSVVFEVALDLKPDRTGAPVFIGDFAHGPPKERFLYLGWRNTNGAYAQRLKVPLSGITWSDIDKAKGTPLIGELAPSRKRVPGATNVGGTRAVVWKADG